MRYPLPYGSSSTQILSWQIKSKSKSDSEWQSNKTNDKSKVVSVKYRKWAIFIA